MNALVHRATNQMLHAVRQHCESYHYLHRWPDVRSLPFGYCLQYGDSHYAPDGRLWGLVVFKKPQHHQQRGLFGFAGLPTSWQVLDLARVWVHPDLQRKQGNHSLCIFSQMVGKAIRRVQADWLIHHPPRYPDQPYHIEVIISYCDRAHHDGTGYRASGFTWNGYTSDQTKEVYYRRLSPPLKRWQPTQPVQLPLLVGFPLVHASDYVSAAS
jgi:hypothetical protein